MGVQSYRDLTVWQRSFGLLDGVYDLTEGLPHRERFNMVSQMERAVVSVPSNIAEGCATGSTRMYLRHLAIARGSLAEVETLAFAAHRRRYIDDETRNAILDLSTEIGRMLVGLQRSLRARLKSPPNP